MSMRKDITVEKITLGGEKLNKSALARQFGCCWETIDRRLNATGVYFLLKNKYGYNGKYGIVRNYVSSKKKNITSNLTIRFETIKLRKPL